MAASVAPGRVEPSVATGKVSAGSGVATSLPRATTASPTGSAASAATAPFVPAPKQNALETRVTRLDTLVGLTPEQQARVAEIFRKEADALADIPNADRALQGMDARKGARAEVRALLTPEQRKKYDVSPQTLGGGMRTNPENLAQRLHEIVALTPEQKRQVTAIFMDDIIDQMAALPPEEELPGFRWHDKVRGQLRTVLTSEQQAKFDVTTPYRASGRPAGAR
jgi:Spy/CpxP family protein refolding chaperone